MSLECEICGATTNKKGETFKDRRQLLAHQKHCKGGEKVADDNSKKCPDCGATAENFQAIKGNNTMEKKALEAGYTAICSKCDELIK